MLLFRSEEHIGKWCEQWSQPRGESFTAERCWALAQSWYGKDRRDEDWRRKTPEETVATFVALGFTSPFWEI